MHRHELKISMQNNLPNQQFVRGEFYSGFYTPLKKKKVNTFSNVLNKPFKITQKNAYYEAGLQI